ncbi:hypothetical protein MYP_210 [Sporocytophaga myxococcoides]|uniref:Uncharacterized protein n=1 Tax=Sporocytophaga myxococcoides TaxID=153721 RepID=A0A098L9D8_9BACT|nr:hypothetical protein [Sporocytophaga myxococcoides]GAL82984.1 hypothetical protein MYP_210 [Sporocytophaga myxococcoides]
MRLSTLTEGYEVTEIADGGDKVKIAYTKEGIHPNDFIFLSNSPSLEDIKYQVIDVKWLDGLYYADLVKIS